MMYEIHRCRLVLGGGRRNSTFLRLQSSLYIFNYESYLLFISNNTYVVKSKSRLIHGKHIPLQTCDKPDLLEITHLSVWTFF